MFQPDTTAKECGKQDLNLHDLAATRPSTWRVCQFRHSRRSSILFSLSQGNTTSRWAFLEQEYVCRADHEYMVPEPDNRKVRLEA